MSVFTSGTPIVYKSNFPVDCSSSIKSATQSADCGVFALTLMACPLSSYSQRLLLPQVAGLTYGCRLVIGDQPESTTQSL